MHVDHAYYRAIKTKIGKAGSGLKAEKGTRLYKQARSTTAKPANAVYNLIKIVN